MEGLFLSSVTIDRFRFDVLRLYVNTALVAAAPLAYMYYLMGAYTLAWAVSGYLLFSAAMFLAVRWRMARLPGAARLFVLVTMLLVLFSQYAGSDSLDNKPWILLVPIIAIPLLGAAEGVLWVAGSLLGLGIVYALLSDSYAIHALIIQLAAVATTAYVVARFTLFNESNIDRISQMSHVDPLTGSYNRRSFDANFQKEYQRAKRNKASLTVMMIDIDHFKEYNDRYGHQEGDQVLIKVAAVLDDTVRRASDLVYRYGGEEFCVLMSAVDKVTAVALAEQMRKRVHELCIPHETVLPGYLTISVGLCHSYELDSTSPEAMLHAADDAMYQAKQRGRNRVMLANNHAAAA
jgi:diguanylate cyclase (GGDEF)-like protein